MGVVTFLDFIKILKVSGYLHETETNSDRYELGRPVYCAVSQNGGLPHIHASMYSIYATFYVFFTNVIRNSDAIIAKKQQK